MQPSRVFAVLLVALLAFPSDSGTDHQCRTCGQPLPSALEAPEYLSELARAMLARRMARHGRDLTLLVQSVVMLQRGLAADLAANIAAEPRIVRPLPGDMDELNAALPERFFVLQDELRDRAKAVAEAARARNDAKLAQAFGLLTQTCVACHAAYLEPVTK